jgi:outer membrane protein OmpA-like peptidoglycan-associated protein
MNRRVVKTVCAAVVLSAMITAAFSQKNYYVVIGAFATEKGDIKEFTGRLPENQSDTAYTIYPDENLMHFYLMKTSDREEALEKSMKLQEAIQKRDVELVNAVENYRSENQASPTQGEQGVVIADGDLTGSSSTVAGETAGTGVPSEKDVVLPKGKFFKFKVETMDGNPIIDNVHHVNLIERRELGTFPTYQNVDVLRPANPQPMTVVCGVFGYKEIRKDIDYFNPRSTDGVYLDEEGAWVIPYRLERLKKMDVSVMYNVAFYKDAAFMLPTSKKDLDELVTMMKTNPNYVIKVHAHCNSKNSRKIIAPGESVQYFDVEGAVEQKGSAKLLTKYRAELVKSYLIENGIEEKRIKTFGWGGSEMLVEENSLQSKLNDRIEIEILED